MIPPLQSLLRAQNLPSRGLVHCGAHHGQELGHYVDCGFEHILLIEANPFAFPTLQYVVEKWQPLVRDLGIRVQAIQRAVWDHQGLAWFHRTQSETMSSLLRPEEPLVTLNRVEVPCSPLPAIMQEAQFPPEACNVLVLDLQGAELRVLQSAGEILKGLDLIITEVNDQPRYEGCPGVEEIDSFLNRLGFFRWMRSGPFPGCPAGDAVYLNLNSLPIPYS